MNILRTSVLLLICTLLIASTGTSTAACRFCAGYDCAILPGQCGDYHSVGVTCSNLLRIKGGRIDHAIAGRAYYVVGGKKTQIASDRFLAAMQARKRAFEDFQQNMAGPVSERTLQRIARELGINPASMKSY